MRRLAAAIALGISGAMFGESMNYAKHHQPWSTMQFTYKYPKKQNKLSQKAKRKRARRLGKHG